MIRTRLTPLGRILILVLIITLGAMAGKVGASATRPQAQAWRCVAVRPGDTLWGLAGGAGDRRETVEQIVDHNGLTGTLEVGATIWVPSDAGAKHLLGADPTLCPRAA